MKKRKTVKMKPTKVWAVVNIYHGTVEAVEMNKGKSLYTVGPGTGARWVEITLREPRRTRSKR